MKPLALAVLLALPLPAQLFGPITDAPQHVLAVGAGVGPDASVSGFVGVGEKLPGLPATYSYSGIVFVPAFREVEGRRLLVVTPTLQTGLQQVLLQRGRLSIAVDGGAGASMPTAGSGLNFSGSGAALIAWKLGHNSDTTRTGHYLAIRPSVTQTPYGPIFSIGIGYAHAIQ